MPVTNIKLKIIFSSLLIVLFIISFNLVLSKTASALSSYSNSDLINDAIFLDSSSMTQSQIQSFLFSQGSYLANYTSYSSRDNTNVLASQIIYEASQDYGINPQVILATMQKEESLVTDPDPLQSQLDFAMGYECADSTGCSAYSGLFNQVDNGTWQLRFDYDKLTGSIQLGGSSTLTSYEQSESYPCGTSSIPPPYSSTNNTNYHFYYPGLTSGTNVTFYDGYGTAYTNFTIANASTASLYCYTPHAYPGSSKDYYSGSYNFVVAFDSWWGNSTPEFQATYSGQSGYPTMVQGQTSSAYILYQNTGNEPWYDDVSAPQLNTYPIHLATTNPINSASPLGATWPANDRLTGTFSAVYNSDGVTLASNQHVAQPGQIVKFSFVFTAPTNFTGTYVQYVQPILEGSALWNMGGVAWWNVTVQP